MPRPPGPPVVLVHGLWLSGWAMSLVARRLRGCGFRTYLFSYASVRKDLRENAAALRAFSDGIEGRTVHYVGHSLGGVLILAMLAHTRPTRPGRVVTLCSPLGGSRTAQTLSRVGWGRSVLGRSIADLLRDGLPAQDVTAREVGVIKGDLPLGLGRVFADLGGPNDGVVACSEMDVAGAADAVTFRVSHSGMLLSGRVARATCQFLRFGHFIR
jgi:pimeloyl-ACP methyl ester carboxylesterase